MVVNVNGFQVVAPSPRSLQGNYDSPWLSKYMGAFYNKECKAAGPVIILDPETTDLCASVFNQTLKGRIVMLTQNINKPFAHESGCVLEERYRILENEGVVAILDYNPGVGGTYLNVHTEFEPINEGNILILSFGGKGKPTELYNFISSLDPNEERIYVEIDNCNEYNPWEFYINTGKKINVYKTVLVVVIHK